MLKGNYISTFICVLAWSACTEWAYMLQSVEKSLCTQGQIQWYRKSNLYLYMLVGVLGGAKCSSYWYCTCVNVNALDGLCLDGFVHQYYFSWLKLLIADIQNLKIHYLATLLGTPMQSNVIQQLCHIFYRAYNGQFVLNFPRGVDLPSCF